MNQPGWNCKVDSNPFLFKSPSINPKLKSKTVCNNYCAREHIVHNNEMSHLLHISTCPALISKDVYIYNSTNLVMHVNQQKNCSILFNSVTNLYLLRYAMTCITPGKQRDVTGLLYVKRLK